MVVEVDKIAELIERVGDYACDEDDLGDVAGGFGRRNVDREEVAKHDVAEEKQKDQVEELVVKELDERSAPKVVETIEVAEVGATVEEVKRHMNCGVTL